MTDARERPTLRRTLLVAIGLAIRRPPVAAGHRAGARSGGRLGGVAHPHAALNLAGVLQGKISQAVRS